MKRLCSVLLTTMLTVSLFTSCSKKDKPGDPPGSPQGKNMKITISATGLTANDYLTMTISGGTVDGTQKTLYKLNNTVLENQAAFTVEQAKLVAGPVVIETVVPVALTSITMGGFSTQGRTFSINIRAVIDGKDQTPIDQVYTSATLTKNYQFK